MKLLSQAFFRTWKINTSTVLLVALLSSLLYPAQSKAQDTSHYFSVSYVKLKSPADAKEYESDLSYYVKKVVQYRINQGHLQGWSAWKLIMPTGASTDYDYLVAVSSKDMQELLDDTLGLAAAKSAVPDMDETVRQNVANQMNNIRYVVKKEIYRTLAETNMSTQPPKYAEIDYMKPAAGKYDAYINAEKNTWMLVHKDRIKLGALSDWELDEKVLPGEANASYDLVTANFFNNIPMMMDPKYAQAFKDVWPKMDINKVGTDANATRTIVKSDVLKLVDYVFSKSTTP